MPCAKSHIKLDTPGGVKIAVYPPDQQMMGAGPLPFDNVDPMQQMAAQQLQPPLPPPPPDPSTWARARGKPFSSDFITHATEFIGNEMKASSEFMTKKVERAKLIKQMFNGEIGYHQLFQALTTYATNPKVIRNNQWQADFLVSCAPIVHSYTDRIFGSLFASERYWDVSLDPDNVYSVEDPVKPTSKKIQALLLRKNTEWQFLPEMYRIVQDGVMNGLLHTKVFYHKEIKNIWRRVPGTGEMVPIPQVIEFPIIKLMPLDMALPDCAATDSDCQRWTGIGQRIKVPYARVLQRFNEGAYNLNRTEFEGRFANATDDWTDTDYTVWVDVDLNYITNPTQKAFVTLWEWHGAVPLDKGGFQEVIATFCTENQETDPTGGMLIRLDHGPALVSGLRPFLVSQFSPTPSVFGKGAVEPNFDLIFYMSDMLNQIIDNARLTVNAQYKIRRGTTYANDLKANPNGDLVYPGKRHYVDDPNDVMPLEQPPLNTATMERVIQFWEKQYNQRTNIDDNTLAMSGREKTAYEAHQISQMADVPLQSRLQIFVRTIFEPFGDISIKLLQENLQEPQQVSIKGPSDTDVPWELSLDEIRTGKYKVAAALNSADQMRVAKMQSLERVMPLLMQSDQWLMAEGKQVNKAGIILELLKFAGIEGLDRFITDVDPQQAQALEIIKTLPPEILQQLIMMIQGQMGPEGSPEPAGNGAGPGTNQLPQPHQLGSDGSPLGTEDRTDLGAMLQMLQMQQNDCWGYAAMSYQPPRQLLEEKQAEIRTQIKDRWPAFMPVVEQAFAGLVTIVEYDFILKRMTCELSPDYVKGFGAALLGLKNILEEMEIKNGT